MAFNGPEHHDQLLSITRHGLPTHSLHRLLESKAKKRVGRARTRVCILETEKVDPAQVSLRRARDSRVSSHGGSPDLTAVISPYGGYRRSATVGFGSRLHRGLVQSRLRLIATLLAAFEVLRATAANRPHLSSAPCHPYLGTHRQSHTSIN